MKLSIVIPVYHEAKNILKVISLLNRQVSTPHELLIVYDYRADPTFPVVNRWLQETAAKNIFLVKNNQGTGRGVMNAIKTGLLQSRGEAVVVLMADLSDDITQIDKMYQLIKSGADIVCASRYMKGGQKIGGPWFKTLLSRSAGLSLYHFFRLPTHDATNAFKMYRTAIFRSIKIESRGGFEYSMEIVIKAFKQGKKIVEIPTTWKDRVNGQSNFKLWQWLPEYLKCYSLIWSKPSKN